MVISFVVLPCVQGFTSLYYIAVEDRLTIDQFWAFTIFQTSLYIFYHLMAYYSLFEEKLRLLGPDVDESSINFNNTKLPGRVYENSPSRMLPKREDIYGLAIVM